MPLSATARQSVAKQVICTNCARTTAVGQRAMSIFCPHCKQRLILENFKIKTYYAVREFFTCGDITVEKKGHVVAPVRVGKLTVKGKLQGSVSARGTVHISKTGWFKGDIQAPSIRVDRGGVLDGFVRIGTESALDE